ncbi:hypothetical protein CJ673_04230 [Aliarcobacter cryaerophilus]|uniref:Uncharacterized protein n=1 Tax=Aliarcobacter cryaerophilus TaxID=28198 RepID=A0A2S9T7F8_9BACT|nr:hypothetical protein [Aliarcobacter cryaerophilus]PRM94775.1 hypothetical protein CJ673_04230 [Aliarcobacter cryaerophilus]
MKFLKYTLIAIFSIIIAKWLITLLPSSYTEKDSFKVNKTEESKEIKIDISFRHLERPINDELKKAQKDIDKFTDQKINEFNDTAKYNLSKEDGFLDWLFGWSTGYQMIWKKLKSYAGSEDNEIKFVENKFKEDVLNYENILKEINDYSKNRINDFYTTSLSIVLNDIEKKNIQLKEYKSEYTFQDIENQNLPWVKYITQLGTDGFEVSTIVASTIIGKKVATVLGPKVLGVVLTKAVTTMIAGKVAFDVRRIIFALIIDYTLNEAAKALQYDSTKKQFEDSIDDIASTLKEETKKEYHNQLLEIKNEITEELNKTISIKGKK